MRVLSAVAEHGSIAAAAQALAFTPSAVSQQIATLEREAGVALVERGPRSVRLTEAGRALVAHTDGIVASLAAAEAEIQAIAGLRGGMLRLSSFPTAFATIMPHAIGEFRRRHPAVELSLTDIMDKLVVDDWGQCKAGMFGSLRAHVDAGKLSEATLYAELGEIVAGRKRGRERDDETILLWHRGLSLSDIALGAAMLDKAARMGVGQTLRYA